MCQKEAQYYRVFVPGDECSAVVSKQAFRLQFPMSYIFLVFYFSPPWSTFDVCAGLIPKKVNQFLYRSKYADVLVFMSSQKQ